MVGGSLSNFPVIPASARGSVNMEKGRDLEVTIRQGMMPERRDWIHFHNSSGTTLKKQVGSDVTLCTAPGFLQKGTAGLSRGAVSGLLKPGKKEAVVSQL